MGSGVRSVPKVWFGWAVIAVALASVALGAWLYGAHAPALDAVQVELDVQGAWEAQSPEVVLAAVRWDYVFIVGYGLALVLGTQVARWVFWTPKAARAALVGAGAAWTVVVADVLENLALTVAAGQPNPAGSGWATAAASVSTIKWAALVPAVVVAVVGILVAATRLLRHGGRTVRARRTGEADRAPGWPLPDEALRLPAPREEDPVDARAGGGILQQLCPWGFMTWQPTPDPTDPTVARGPADEERWVRAYDVPSVGSHELAPDASGRRDVVGVCLSGGGIRSASLALGALESLRDPLRRARYLVSISGGGYTAGAFAQLLTDGGDPNHGDPDDRPDPTDGTVERDAATAYDAGTVELDHIRRHSSYLASTAPQMLVALGVLARGMLATLALVFGPAVTLGVTAAWYLHAVPLVTLPTFPADEGAAGTPLAFPAQVWWALGLVGGAAVLAWLVQMACYNALGGLAARAYLVSRDVAVFATRIGLVVVGVTVAVPAAAWLAWRFGDLVNHNVRFGVSASVGTVLLTYAAGVASLAWRQRKTIKSALDSAAKGKGTRKAAVPTGLAQQLLVILAVTVLVVAWLLLFGVTVVSTATNIRFGSWFVTTVLFGGGTALVVVILGGFFDETSMSLHPFYRRRLAGAFASRTVQRAGHAPDRMVVPYDPSERTVLSEYGRAAESVGAFPEFVFACAANLTGEDRTPPGLTATSFTLGAGWAGGPDVGWVRTADLEAIAPPRLQRDLTVQAAVAISGAAIASAMGRFARWYQILLALTGARLGAWLPNPVFIGAMRRARDPQGAVHDWTLPSFPRVRRMTYLLRELLNVHPFEERLLQVTDGGHYENLGIVEALRRRCTTIYCVDGGGDAPPTAPGLAQAIALARTELGVTIELHHPFTAEPGSGTLPDATPSLAGLGAVLVHDPVIVGTIHYPAASGLPEGHRTGHLVVGRALLWPALPYWLLSYAVQSPVFPHDSTGDQWFGDDQFSAYTELGRCVGAEMLRAKAELAVLAPLP